MSRALCTFIHTHPIVTAGRGRGCFHTNVNFERKVKGASALYCVYILKNKSFVCFYYFNYCYKKPAIFNMWFGGIFCCLFSCLGVLFLFCFSGQKKKKTTLAFSVCTAAGQDIIEVFLKIKEEEK